ncbi:MAG: RNA methyltransferase [candidate division WS1 bacterium]|nr:RNA methyltransferase [candidate division WS1 bacterium]
MIDSPQNQHVKLFRSLAEAKHRRETGLFAMEGRRLVAEAVRAGAELMWAAYSPEKFVGPEADRLLHSLMQANVELHEITPRALAAMTHTETPPGIGAVGRIPETYPLAPSPRGGGSAWWLALWQIRDPGNLGSMVRIAHAFGAAGVVAVGPCADFWDPKVVRASAGSVLWVSLLEAEGLPELRVLFGEDSRDGPHNGTTGVPPVLPAPWVLVAADMQAPLACDEAEYALPCVLLVGSEAHGLPEEVLAAADLRVRIPMPGEAESLNAAVAAGILAFQVSRKAARAGQF